MLSHLEKRAGLGRPARFPLTELMLGILDKTDLADSEIVK